MGVSVFVLRSSNWSIMKVLPCNRLDILKISDYFTHGVTTSKSDLLPAIALFQNCSVIALFQVCCVHGQLSFKPNVTWTDV